MNELPGGLRTNVSIRLAGARAGLACGCHRFYQLGMKYFQGATVCSLPDDSSRLLASGNPLCLALTQPLHEGIHPLPLFSLFFQPGILWGTWLPGWVLLW